MKHLKKMIIAAAIVGSFTACKKDDPSIIIPPSSGAEVEFNGIVNAEAGGSAGYSVYIDFSADSMTRVRRASWDLGFYSGSDFRVILNNTTSAGAKVLNENDLTAVDATDTVGLTLSVNQMGPAPSDYAYFDALSGNITATVIPAVSSTDGDNKVIILNRGTGGGTPARPWVKLRVLRNGNGYKVEFTDITSSTIKTINIPKDNSYHFTYLSLDGNGSIVSAQPEKAKWDLVWTYTLYETSFSGNMVPYNYADVIAINHLSNVQAAEKIYADADVATAAFNAFNQDSVNNTTLVSNRWEIGSKWRSTSPATGAALNRFYIIKDPNGNYYKFRCLSMGVGSDGGTRGKPVFRYTLIED